MFGESARNSMTEASAVFIKLNVELSSASSPPQRGC